MDGHHLIHPSAHLLPAGVRSIPAPLLTQSRSTVVVIGVLVVLVVVGGLFPQIQALHEKLQICTTQTQPALEEKALPGRVYPCFPPAEGRLPVAVKFSWPSIM